MVSDLPIQVCLVDDHQIVLEGLGLLIGSAEDIHCVFTATGATEALSQMNHFPVDLVLTDIELPEMDGIAFCRQLKEKFPAVKVIALTMFNELSLIRQMIDAGADGYLLKNAGREELLTAIRRVHSGKNHFSSEIAEILVRGDKKERPKTSSIPSLSGREKQIVRLIMEEYTSAQIADSLQISLNTVETHRRNIMSKLNSKNTAGIVRTVLQHGLLDDENS